MGLIFWWLPPILIVILVVTYVLLNKSVKARLKKQSELKKLPLANSTRLTNLPEYAKQINRYQRLVKLALLSVGLVLLATITVSGRPSAMTVSELNMKNRDIVLCLDVSGSMVKADAEITRIYAEMAEQFDGERLSLVIFDSSPVVVFPLTNDYSFVKEQLADASRAFGAQYSTDKEESSRLYDLISGTSEGSGSSVIGDGLAGCVNRFDRLDSKRSRSIVLGTDNYLAGSPIVTLMEAAQIAKDKDIRVYGINPADYSTGSYQSDEAVEFKKATLLTNGDYYKTSDNSAISSIVQKIVDQDATRFKGAPQAVHTDKPHVFLYITYVSLCVFIVLAWRLNL